LWLCGLSTASTGRNEGARLVARHFQRSQPFIFSPLVYSTQTPSLRRPHGAAMRSLARFMFIAIATN
jgi:hypothetical protein